MRIAVQFFKSVFGFFAPKRNETAVILLSLFLLVAVMVVEFVKSFDGRMAIFSNSPLTEFSLLWIFGTSIAAGLGTFRGRELKKARWFVAGLILILAYCGWLLFRESLLGGVARSQRQKQGGSTLLPLVGTGVLMLAAFGVTKLVLALVEMFKQKFSVGSLTRQKIMIGVAIIMFLVLTFRNIVSQNNLDFSSGSWNRNPLIQLVIGSFGLMAAVALPAWGISLIRGRWAWLISIVYLSAMAALFGTFVGEQIGILIVVYAFVFSSVVVALTNYREMLMDVTQLADSMDAPSAKVSRRSIWGVAVPIVALLTAAALWNFDGFALIWGGSQRFQIARQLKDVATRPGVQAHFDLDHNFNTIYVHSDILLQENAEADCLSPYAKSTFMSGFGFSNLTPEIETKYVRNITKWHGSVERSRITSAQLDDLTSTVNSFSLSQVEIIGPQTKNAFPSLGNLYLQDIIPGETAKLLRCIDEEKFTGNVSLHSYAGELSVDDWEQVLESSRHFSISVYRPPNSAAIQMALQNDIPRKLLLTGIEPQDPVFWELVCKTQISVQANHAQMMNEASLFWDAALASRGDRWAMHFFQNFRNKDPKFEEFDLGEQSPWIYQRNEAGIATSMLFPFERAFLEQAASLKELEALSFDVRWLDSLRKISDNTVIASVDVSNLGQLTKLKRLDLAPGIWGRDYSFLSQLTELEHLQLDVFANGTKNVDFGFRAKSCPNLKSLVLIGQPSKAMAIEISKLPKLQSLKVIDVDLSLFAPAQIKQLQTAIGPKIKLEVVASDEAVPDVPVAFRKHLEKVRESISEKYLDDEAVRSVK